MNNTLILTYPDTHSLRKALLRINIAYEGSEIKNLIGVNFPVKFLNDWVKTKNPVLTEEEKKIFYMAKNYQYVIAFTENDKNTFLHESAHALYFLDANYREKAHYIWNNLSEKLRNKISKDLELLGYKSQNFIDEFQAYTVEDSSFFGKSNKAELWTKIKPLIVILKKN